MRRAGLVVVTVLAIAGCPGGSSRPGSPRSSVNDGAAAAPVGLSLAQTGLVPAWLDRGVDPCEDFFAYACGGFLATAVIPADRASWSTIQLVVDDTETFLRDVLEQAAADPGVDPGRQQLADHYAACMDEDAIEQAGTTPLRPLLDIIARVKDVRTATVAIGELHAIGIFPFFEIGPSPDFADASQVIALLDQRGLGLPGRDYYLDHDGDRADVRASYRAHVGRMFALLGGRPAAGPVAAADVLRIETALATLQQDEVTRRDPHAIFHRVDRVGLEQVARSFGWGAYLARLGLGAVTAIAVHDPAYYAGVTRLLGREKPAALRHYLTWTVLDAVADDLGRAFVDERFTMAGALTGARERAPRWRRCLQRVDEALGELLGQAFVAARFSGEARQLAIELTGAVRAAMEVQLEALPWMDDVTRGAARDKLGKLAYLVGYPDRWRDYPVAISRTDFAGNVRASTRHERARQLGKIGKPVDRLEWQMTAPTVNAYYDATLNQIALPAGQLQPPFFGRDFHPAVNFGATGGGTIGHELTHGFDDEGSQFDGDGNLRDWWSETTSERFAEATQCVVDQYAAYQAVPGVYLDGKLTAGENIADIGGVKLGLQAYQRWRGQQASPPPATVDGFSDEQLYFLAYGQSWCSQDTPARLEAMARVNPHSPPRWRVNGVVIDQPGFAEAFACDLGTPMNPGDACAVW